MKKISKSNLTRRQFLTRTGAALAFPMIVPSSVFGANGTVAPSNRVIVGAIGWGMQGPPNTKAMLDLPNCRVIAVCDLEAGPRQEALDTVNGKYHNKDCAAYQDYREILARTDIDAVMIAIPELNTAASSAPCSSGAICASRISAFG